MIPHRNNETSSQPANDLGGAPAVRDSFGKASARWGYVAGSPSLRHMPRRGFAWQMQAFAHARLPLADLLCRPQPVICPGPAMGQPGARGKYGERENDTEHMGKISAKLEIRPICYTTSLRTIAHRVYLLLQGIAVRDPQLTMKGGTAMESPVPETKQIPNTESKTYRVEDICRLLNIGRSSAYNLVREGHFKIVRIGTAIRISKKSFDEWLEAQQ